MKLHNPYVGPRAFEEEDSHNFFGREEETHRLASLVIARRVVLLYSPSGAGKTSLLKAGLIPYLKQRKRINILPISRVGGDIPPDMDRTQVQNIYVFNTLLDLSGENSRPGDLVGRSLSKGLATHFVPQSGQRRAQPCLLILDQFEELFITYIEHYPERADFFFQLQNSLEEHPQMSLLLSMREDFIAQLDSYAAQLPDRLRTRFRLELLGEEAARQAVQEPARQAEVDFTDTATEKLVNDLRKVQVQQPDGTIAEQPGPYIEPVQLQVVCRRLWEKLPDDATQIGKADVEAVGDVDTALANYYAERVKAIAQETGVHERAIREWFDRQLITEQEIRGQVLWGSEQSQRLDNRAIGFLINAHLVRAEKRLNATWYELAHDRLIEPVRKNNAEWFQTNLSAFQYQATLWERSGRSSDLLLRGQELVDAERWATDHDSELTSIEHNFLIVCRSNLSMLEHQAILWENRDRSSSILLRDEELVEAEHWATDHQDELTSIERDFLSACRESRTIARREKKQAYRIRLLATFSTIITVVVIITFLVAYYQWAETEKTKIKAEVERERAKQLTLNTFESRLAYSSTLAHIDKYAEAQEVLDEIRKLEDIPAEQHHARNLLAWFIDLMGQRSSRTYKGSGVRLFNVAISPDNQLLAAVGEKGAVVLFDPESGDLLKHLQGHTDKVYEVAFHPQGHWLATAGDDRRIIFWSLPNGEKLVEWETPGKVRTLAISPDGEHLVSGGTDNNLTLWDVETGKTLQTLKGHSDSVQGLAFSPDGRLLTSGSADKTARIWDLKTGKTLHTLTGHTDSLIEVVFHPNGQILATSSDDRTIRLWKTASGQLIRMLLGHKSEVNGLVFVESGSRLVSASRDHTLRVWDPETGVTLRVLQGHTASVNRLTARDGRVFSVSDDQTLRRWDIHREEIRGDMQIFDLPGEPTASAIALDGSSIAVGFHNGALRLYTLPDVRLLWEQTEAHKKVILSIVFSPSGSHLASASLDKTVKLWQVSNGHRQKPFIKRRPSEIYRVTFAPDDKFLAFSDYSGQIGLVDLNQAKGRSYKAHKGIVNSVNFDASGQYLLSTGNDGETRLWKLNTRLPGSLKKIKSFPKAQGKVIWAAFSPDNRHIATVGQDLLVHILCAKDSTEEWTLPGHEDTILRAIFGPDGKQMATVSTDATVRFWDLTSGTELFTLQLPANIGRPAPVWDFDFRCTKPSTGGGECWLAVPLYRGKLVLYHLGQPYD